MSFNNNKFELLSYGINSEIKENSKYFAPDGSEIENKSLVKDLGVMMSSGSFSEHINKTCKKLGICALGFLEHSFHIPLTYANTMEVLSATYSRLLFPTLVPYTAWSSRTIGRSSQERSN